MQRRSLCYWRGQPADEAVRFFLSPEEPEVLRNVIAAAVDESRPFKNPAAALERLLGEPSLGHWGQQITFRVIRAVPDTWPPAPALLRALDYGDPALNDASNAVREAAAQRVGALGARLDGDAIDRLLSSETLLERLAAAAVIEYQFMEDTLAVPTVSRAVLEQAMRDPDLRVRRAAGLASATGGRNEERADADRLLDLLRDPAMQVRTAASQALTVLLERAPDVAHDSGDTMARVLREAFMVTDTLISEVAAQRWAEIERHITRDGNSTSIVNRLSPVDAGFGDYFFKNIFTREDGQIRPELKPVWQRRDDVLVAIVQALAALARHDVDVVDALTHAATQPESAVCNAALKALGNVQGAQAREKAVNCIRAVMAREDHGSEAYEAALDALRSLGAPPLEEWLTSSSWKLRSAALVHYGGKLSTETLLEKLVSPDNYGSDTKAIVQVLSVRRTEAPPGRIAAALLAMRDTGDDDWRVKSGILDALHELAALVPQASAWGRQAIVGCLAYLCSAEAGEENHDAGGETSALNSAEVNGVLDMLEKAANDDAAEVRVAAMGALRAMRTSVRYVSKNISVAQRVTAVLLHGLDDANTQVRQGALEALAVSETGLERSDLVRIAALVMDPNADIQTRAVDTVAALAMIDRDLVEDTLLSILRLEGAGFEESARSGIPLREGLSSVLGLGGAGPVQPAIKALVALAPVKNRQGLIQGLMAHFGDGAGGVRRDALEAAGKVGDSSAISAVQRALGDSWGLVVDAAEETLRAPHSGLLCGASCAGARSAVAVRAWSAWATVQFADPCVARGDSARHGAA